MPSGKAADFRETFDNALRMHVRDAVEKAMKEEAGKSVSALYDRLQGEIDKLALSIMRHYRLEERADHLVITVDRKALEIPQTPASAPDTFQNLRLVDRAELRNLAISGPNGAARAAWEESEALTASGIPNVCLRDMVTGAYTVVTR